MVLNKFRIQLQKPLKWLVTILVNIGISPFQLSFAGVILAILAAFCYQLINYQRVYFYIGIVLFVASNLADALDGLVARYQNRVTEFGAFVDSFFDRLAEVIIIFSLMLSGLVNPCLSMLFLSTSLLISYIRARAEALGVNMSGVGLMERAERGTFLFAGLVLWLVNHKLLEITILTASVLNIFTIIQRLYHTRMALQG